MSGKKLSSKSEEMNTKQASLESENLSEFLLRAKDSKEVLKQKIRKNVYVRVSECEDLDKTEDIGATGEESNSNKLHQDLMEKEPELDYQVPPQEACGEAFTTENLTDKSRASLKPGESTESVGNMRKVRFNSSVTSVDFDSPSNSDTEVFHLGQDDQVR